MRDLQPPKRGKVRDIYDLGDTLLIVATDRISAFDVVLPNAVPEKGSVLTQISKFWFAQTETIVQNHLISTDVREYPGCVQAPRRHPRRQKHARQKVSAASRGVHCQRLFDRLGTERVQGKRLRQRHQASPRPDRGIPAA